MMWTVVLIVAVLFLLMHCHDIFTAIWIYLGPRAFTRRKDGRFSSWQIVGQVVVVGIPALLTLGLFASWISATIRGN